MLARPKIHSVLNFRSEGPAAVPLGRGAKSMDTLFLVLEGLAFLQSVDEHLLPHVHYKLHYTNDVCNPLEIVVIPPCSSCDLLI
jgi:hypothetical protein